MENIKNVNIEEKVMFTLNGKELPFKKEKFTKTVMLQIVRSEALNGNYKPAKVYNELIQKFTKIEKNNLVTEKVENIEKYDFKEIRPEFMKACFPELWEKAERIRKEKAKKNRKTLEQELAEILAMAS